MSLQATAATARTRGWLAGTLALDLRTTPPDLVQRLKRELSLYQRGFNGDGRLVCFALEYDGWLHVPRGYPLTKEGAWLLDEVVIDEHRSLGHALPAGCRANVTFGAPPYPPDQPKAIRQAVENTRRNTHGGLFLAPTRSGKTLCSVEVACRLGGSTLILVDRKPLIDQWKEAIEKHVVDAEDNPVRCGVIRAESHDLPPEYPFVVATLQTVVNRPELSGSRGWRTVIVDECQGAPCALVWSALRRIECHYVFGLSATPDRSDGLGPAIPWIIGPQIAELHREMHADVHFLQIAYADEPIPKRKGSKNTRPAKLTKPTGAVNTVEAEKALLRDSARTARVAREAHTAIQSGRQVLVLVGLRDHASALARECRRLGLEPGLYIGGQASTAEMKKNPVIATYGIAAKGIDFQPPPTLCILAGPRSDVRQAIGRVLQPQAPHTPMILDIVDGARPLIGQAHRRRRFYEDRQFNVRNEVWG